METLQQADVRAGRMRFIIAGAGCIGMGLLTVLVLVLWMKAEVHYLFWMRLLGILVALGGTARGSTPIKFLLVFLVMIGVGFALAAAWGSGFEPLVVAATVLEILPSLALCYFTLFDDKVNAYFLHQRWRNFGERVRMEKETESLPEKAKPGSKQPGKDELGLFEED